MEADNDQLPLVNHPGTAILLAELNNDVAFIFVDIESKRETFKKKYTLPIDIEWKSIKKDFLD